MKRILSISLAILLFATIFQSCKKTANDLEVLESKVEFAFSADQLKSSDLQGLTSAVVTIEDLQGNVIKNSEKIEIYNMSGSYISQPISLVTGEYKLTRFMVLSANDEVVYVSPMAGSNKASEVQNPLAISFFVQKDSVKKIDPEVLSTAESTPGDFGYTSFNFDIAETFDFFIDAFILDSISQEMELATANIYIFSEYGVIYTDTLESNASISLSNIETLGFTNRITLPEKYDTFAIQISKNGYRSFRKTFSKEELRLHYRKEDKGPLVVTLIKQNNNPTEPIDPNAPHVVFDAYPDNSTYSGAPIIIDNFSETGADMYLFDFGDGGNVTSTQIVRLAHTYNTSGNYNIKLFAIKGNHIGIYEREINLLPVNNGGCYSSAGSNQKVSVYQTNLSASAVPAGAIGTWSVIYGSANITDVHNPKSQVTNLGYGVNVFQWTINSEFCGTSDMVAVIYSPFEANAGADQTICTNNATLRATDPSPSGTGEWTLLTGAGAINNPNSATTTVSGIIVGTNVFRWTVTNGEYTLSDDVTIINNQVIANAGTDMEITSSSCSLSANSPARGSGTWTCSTPNVSINSPQSSATEASNIPLGISTFTWTVRYYGCSNQDNMVVNRTSK